MSAWGLVISVFGIAIYFLFVSRLPSGWAFVAGTGVAFVASLVSLGLSVVGWRSGERRWLRLLSVAVAVGFVVTMGILVVNVVVYGLL